MKTRTIASKTTRRPEATSTTVTPGAVWKSLTTSQQNLVRQKLVRTCQQLLRPGRGVEHG